jgi:hypothetical protein
MGFFSNLVNKVTGGGAKVTIMPEGPSLTGKFKVSIKAIIGDNDIKISNVYINVRSIEKARVRNVHFPASGSQSSVTKDVTGEEEITKAEYIVAEAQTLTAGQEYSWTYEMQLPSGALPTFIGRNVSHEWEMLAGLDAPGNDPDSGWWKFEAH